MTERKWIVTYNVDGRMERATFIATNYVIDNGVLYLRVGADTLASWNANVWHSIRPEVAK